MSRGRGGHTWLFVLGRVCVESGCSGCDSSCKGPQGLLNLETAYPREHYSSCRSVTILELGSKYMGLGKLDVGMTKGTRSQVTNHVLVKYRHRACPVRSQ
jgi:hypothetical protein